MNRAQAIACLGRIISLMSDGRRFPFPGRLLYPGDGQFAEMVPPGTDDKSASKFDHDGVLITVMAHWEESGWTRWCLVGMGTSSRSEGLRELQQSLIKAGPALDGHGFEISLSVGKGDSLAVEAAPDAEGDADGFVILTLPDRNVLCRLAA